MLEYYKILRKIGRENNKFSLCLFSSFHKENVCKDMEVHLYHIISYLKIIGFCPGQMKMYDDFIW